MDIYYIVTYVTKDGETKTQIVSSDNLEWFKSYVASQGGSVIHISSKIFSILTYFASDPIKTGF